MTAPHEASEGAGPSQSSLTPSNVWIGDLHIFRVGGEGRHSAFLSIHSFNRCCCVTCRVSGITLEEGEAQAQFLPLWSSDSCGLLQIENPGTQRPRDLPTGASELRADSSWPVS